MATYIMLMKFTMRCFTESEADGLLRSLEAATD
ncbi:hypothetical protein BH18ACT4_BH18ACT4_15650 [soil metagenome]